MLPTPLQGDRWQSEAARAAMPLLIWCAKNGQTITYGGLDQEIINRGWGHHVFLPAYGGVADRIGNALIETGNAWGDSIPPLNSLIISATTGIPSSGFDLFLERYYEPDKDIDDLEDDEKRAIIEEIHSDVFSYEHWDQVLEEYNFEQIDVGIIHNDTSSDDIDPPQRGGWSSEGESKEHKKLKEYIANHPSAVGLPRKSKNGITEYQFSSGDKADVVFQLKANSIAVEVKSIISNNADLNRGIFQAVKYQSLLRAEQKATLSPPIARAVLVTERPLPDSLQNLADLLAIRIFVCTINH